MAGPSLAGLLMLSIADGRLDFKPPNSCRMGSAALRYTVRRNGRELRAVNFQREAGKISFSAASHDYPLPAGAQDRLSWMAQLAAIVAGDVQRWRAGERITLYIAGASGQADLWHFDVQGEELVALPAAATPALRLLRQPQRPYDPQWELWLSAAHGYWPVRVVQSTQPVGATVEWLLVSGPDEPAR
jgi:Protein of unknown function (DUF3108)